MDKLYFADIGELGWALYLSAHIRWLKQQGKEAIVMTSPHRECLYPKIIDLPKEFYDKYGNFPTDGFTRRGVPGPELRDFFKKYITIPDYFTFSWQVRDEYLKDKMIFRPYLTTKKYSHKRIIVFSRYRKEHPFSLRNLPESFYKKLISKLCEAMPDTEVYSIGSLKGAYNINLKYPNYINLIGKTTIQDMIDLTTGAVGTVGSQSAPVKISLLQGIPAYIIGHEKKRHIVDENWMGTKVNFWELGIDEYNTFNSDNCIKQAVNFLAKDSVSYSWGLVQGEEKYALSDSLFEVARHFGKINIIEVGCRDGRTSKTLIQICKDNGIKFNYYGIDIADRGVSLLEDMNFIQCDANDENVLGKLPDKFHFILIDACHCKECVLKQIDIYARRLAEKGIIAFHDYGVNSQGMTMSESHDTSKDLRVGVEEAIKELDLKSKYNIFREIEFSKKGILCLQK